jgi:hypothetical protein
MGSGEFGAAELMGARKIPAGKAAEGGIAGIPALAPRLGVLEYSSQDA